MSPTTPPTATLPQIAGVISPIANRNTASLTMNTPRHPIVPSFHEYSIMLPYTLFEYLFMSSISGSLGI